MVLIDCCYPGIQFRQFYDLVIIQPGGLPNQLSVRLIRQAHNNLGIGVTDDCHIQQSRGLVSDDETFSVGAHFCNRIIAEEEM